MNESSWFVSSDPIVKAYGLSEGLIFLVRYQTVSIIKNHNSKLNGLVFTLPQLENASLVCGSSFFSSVQSLSKQTRDCLVDVTLVFLAKQTLSENAIFFLRISYTF